MRFALSQGEITFLTCWQSTRLGNSTYFSLSPCLAVSLRPHQVFILLMNFLRPQTSLDRRWGLKLLTIKQAILPKKTCYLCELLSQHGMSSAAWYLSGVVGKLVFHPTITNDMHEFYLNYEGSKTIVRLFIVIKSYEW